MTASPPAPVSPLVRALTDVREILERARSTGDRREIEAARWYRLSAEQGYDLAMQNLNNLNLKIKPRAFGRP